MDYEKVASRAQELGAGTPIELRWEGSGDSVHAFTILNQLRATVYTGTETPIKYRAHINIYEPFENANAQTAWKYFAQIHRSLKLHADPRSGEVCCDEFYNEEADQRCLLQYGMDVTRDQGSVPQAKAHIMFVRNIMLTSNFGDSLVEETGPLLDLHKQALRKRAGSLSGRGILRLGMSGAPGLIKSNGEKRPGAGPATIAESFHGFNDLKDAGAESGLALITNRQNAKRTPLTLNDDFEKGAVMLNSGKVEQKRTFYLTFQS
ncbi:hypothetical protein [Novosphingobium resinovorum]|uniref:hypothetical protein n=1 Tax=Novosphingobium resinovorum TaxID=158500 RepID=UPI002ED44827|nr:hypothetical protein [Novosphingobium resinovorum]